MFFLVQHQVDHYMELRRALLQINECTNQCNTGATQVQPEMHR